MKKILILGGYGNTGVVLARLLLQETDSKIILAGRNINKADEAAKELNKLFNGERVKGIFADASDSESLKRAFQEIDFVIVASGTVKYVKNIALQVIEAKIGYLDIQVSVKKIAELAKLSGEINKSGCCFITDGGFHPGSLPCQWLCPALVTIFCKIFNRRNRL